MSVEHLDENPILGFVVELLRQLRVNLLQVFGQVADQEFIVIGVVAQLKMLRRQRRVLFQVMEHLERVRDANVERVGIEGFGENGLGFFFPAHAHVEQAEAVLSPGQDRPQFHRFLVVSLGVFEAATLVELTGEDEVEQSRLGVVLLHFLNQLLQFIRLLFEEKAGGDAAQG